VADSCSDVVTAHKVCEHMLVLKVQILVWAGMHVCLLTLQVSGSATVWLHMQRWKISSQHSEQLPRLSDTRKFKKIVIKVFIVNKIVLCSVCQSFVTKSLELVRAHVSLSRNALFLPLPLLTSLNTYASGDDLDYPLSSATRQISDRGLAQVVRGASQRR
jgi:hypothetical protein